MNKKSGNFFEEHIEKIIMAMIGLVCIWLFISRVLISPNTISYDNKKLGTNNIDSYISKQAELLEDKLHSKPQPPQEYTPLSSNFEMIMDNGLLTIKKLPDNQFEIISRIDASVALPLPHNAKQKVVRAIYTLPVIGNLDNVAVEHIRSVAYVPTKTLNNNAIYDRDNTEANDLDLVTVEAAIDITELKKNFYESFASQNVKEQWRDPYLAEPVFAAVQLQRQQLLKNGGWSDWQTLPRTRIDLYAKMFKIIEDVKRLPIGGVKLQILQFKEKQTQAALLQPQPYQIASEKELWFPPALHRKYTKYITEEEQKEKRKEMAAEKERRKLLQESKRTNRAQRTTANERNTRPSRTVSRTRTIVKKPIPVVRRDGRDKQEETKVVRTDSQSIRNIQDEFSKILINKKDDTEDTKQFIVFWAHDDTAKANQKYRYRIRLGVFNPVAGTNQLSQQDMAKKNQAILWSDFSDITDVVKIPAMLYFFPVNIIEASQTITTTVCRYKLGYWYSKKFAVNKGEVIGEIAEAENTEEEKESEDEKLITPETIDYSTNIVLVDVIPSNSWTGKNNLREKYYFDMLYSSDGTEIEHISVKQRYWPKELQKKFNEIKKAQEEPKPTLQAWQNSKTQYPQSTGDRLKRTNRPQRKPYKAGDRRPR
ncbi:MAG: hypothetical protein KAS69_07400 [Planctomycetes bacterium]|nr:hypothetical protein [Planctomycetota bacterium]